MKSIAFFDFDGTIYKGDSMLHFIKAVRGKRFLRRRLFLLSPYIVLLKLGVIDAQKTKEKLLRMAFGGYSSDQLSPYISKFNSKIDTRVYDKAKAKLASFKEKQTEICIVSASLDLWLETWCNKRGYNLLCSEAELIDGHITGKLKGKNCRGPEKARRILEAYNLKHYEKIYAFGNDSGDLEMIALANQPTETLYQ